MNNNGFEIERKFLIAYPGDILLNACRDRSQITQTYLQKNESGVSARVRKREYPDRVEYTHTCKRHITDIRRVEDEHEIGEEEYLRLLLMRDMKRNIITKTRYCLEYKSKLFEIDVYPFWNDRAVMEIELTTEDEGFEIPPEIKVIKEITDDKRYTNASLAKSIPNDGI